VAVQIDPELPAALVPLAWLVGRWAGAGVVGYPTMDDVRFGQEVEFRHDGRPFLHYRSQAWLLDDDGAQVRPLASETGYWRPGPVTLDGEATNGTATDGTATDGAAKDGGASVPPGVEIEVLLAHPTGFVEIYYGTVTGPRITLATDVVARTSSAKEYAAATRLYGLVEGDLLWAMDMAAVGVQLRSHASARLKRVPSG
jgi:hypothetical protein